MPLAIQLTSYNNWLIPLCFIIGFGLAFLYYRKDNKFNDVNPRIVRLLVFLRGLTISIILFLLLSPVVQNEKKFVDPPIIIVAADNSTSLTYNNDSVTIKDIREQLNNLKSRLSENYEVKYFQFGEKVKENEELDFKERESDFSALFEQVSERFENRNVGAMIVFSDGLYNRGANPVYSRYGLEFPVHFVGLGDTSRKIDVQVKDLRYNDIAYLGNTFPLEVELEQHGFDGTQFEVQVNYNGKNIRNTKGRFSEKGGLTDIKFQLDADASGLRKYEVVVLVDGEEENKINNKRLFFIEIIDGRQEILLLANAPHPDIGAIQNALASFDDYALEVKMISDYVGDEKPYDLIITHQIPGNRRGVSSEVLEELRNTPGWHIIGSNSSEGGFNQLDIGASLDVDLRKSNESQAVINPDFSLFSLSEESRALFEDLPPFNAPFGELKFYSDHEVLFTQKIGRVKSDYPLLAFNKKENVKYGYLMGDGIWKWRLWAFKKTGDHKVFSDFVGKIVQYLSVKSDKSRLRIDAKNNFLENEELLFDAEVYNESFELDNRPDVEMKVNDSLGKEYRFVFSRTSDAYSLSAGSLPTGTYNYTATTVGDQFDKLEKKGTFLISPLQLEAFKTAADYQLLYNLSKKMNGTFLTLPGLPTLIESIEKDENIQALSRVEEVPEELINFKILFFLLLLSLSAEWYLRKRNGAY